MTDPNQISAAGIGGGTGDNSNAIAMDNLGNQSLIQPEATTSFGVTQNLDSSTALNGQTTGNVTLYDSLGASHNATITYTNLGANTWGYSISMPETLRPMPVSPNQVSFNFGSVGTVNPGTNLTITGTSGAGTATITAPTVTAGEAVGTAGPPATGYVGALDAALTAAGITGVTVTNTGGVLTIAGATSTAGSVIADPVASANATGTLTFNAITGNLITPAANVGGMTFAGLSDGAAALNVDWGLYGAERHAEHHPDLRGLSAIGRNSQRNSKPLNSQTPIDYYSNMVSTLGSTVSSVQDENTAQTASVAQLQTQDNALSSVNLNDEASALSTLQTSYQAASQMFNTLNTIMESALNLGVETAVS